MIAYTIECEVCYKPTTVHLKAADLKAWQQGELIQNACPYLTPAQRELFISETCENCFDTLFSPPLFG